MSRDIRSLMGSLFIPLLMIFLFGYALSLDVDRIPTVVLDFDRTPTSREFPLFHTGSVFRQGWRCRFLPC
jgi:ABC-2 type transport system permease protein